MKAKRALTDSVGRVGAALAISTLAIGGCVAACRECQGPGTSSVNVSSPESDPVWAGQSQGILAAARAHRINMFGDLGNGERVEYTARSGVSLEQHTFSEIGRDFDPDIDSTGARMVFASTRHNTNPDLYMKSVDGVAVTQITSDPSSDIQPAFSPDDRRVAFAGNRSGNWDIWVVNLDGGQPIQITSGLADEIHPSWSPDGRRLVFCSLPREGGQWELWITDAISGSRKKFIGYGLFPEWSPVDDTILYQRARERGSRWFSIWTLTLENGEPRYPMELAAGAGEAMILPSWGPQGRRIAFTRAVAGGAGGIEVDGAGGVFEVWVMDADGRGKVRLTERHASSWDPVFSCNGRVFFASDRTGYENIWSVIPGGAPDPKVTGTYPTLDSGGTDPGSRTAEGGGGVETALARGRP